MRSFQKTQDDATHLVDVGLLCAPSNESSQPRLDVAGLHGNLVPDALEERVLEKAVDNAVLVRLGRDVLVVPGSRRRRRERRFDEGRRRSALVVELDAL